VSGNLDGEAATNMFEKFHSPIESGPFFDVRDTRKARTGKNI